MPGYLPFTISWSLLKFISIDSVMPFNHFIFSHPLLLLPSIFPSIRVFANELALHIRCSKYWSFNFSISPSNEYSGLISFKIGWLDLFAVQGTQKSSPIPQFKSINSSVLSLLYGPTHHGTHTDSKVTLSQSPPPRSKELQYPTSGISLVNIPQVGCPEQAHEV